MQPVYLWRVMTRVDSVSLQEIRPAIALRSLEETVEHIPDGAYTTFRTYAHFHVLRLEDHFTRLEETGRLAGCPFELERGLLRQALRLAIAAYPENQEQRLRVSVDLTQEPGAVWIGAERLVPLPVEDYERGVKVITCSYVRRNPKAKLSKTMAGARSLRQELAVDVNEALMLDDQDRFLEGLSSNFYVIRDGQLWTADDGVLPGITRQLVIEEVREAGIALFLSGYPHNEIAQAQEAFITSASRGVLPVREVDSVLIGSGQPGPLTRLLAERYAARLRLEVEQI
jgi:branched-chain amino acid aminotransferase